jgi:organic radical activating enzyme
LGRRGRGRLLKISMVDNFYCSQKFTDLSVDLEKKLLYSCCSSTPEKIDLGWLKENPGQLFNSVNLLQERQAMLDNQPVASCQSACWLPESQGLESRRTQYKTHNLTHRDVKTIEPENLNIILGSACNLTCVYCCKQYSTAWTRDIKNNGVYFDNPRFNLTLIDKILPRISQSEHEQSEGFDIIVQELSNYTNLKEIVITGGEPFLYNSFPNLLNSLSDDKNLLFYTGLGVDSRRLKTQLDLINRAEKITAVVSAETCDQLYEFTRYNNTYQKFLANLTILQSYMTVKFLSVLSNVTIHGIVNFVDQFSNHELSYSFCNDPTYLSINVLDDQTKDNLAKTISNSNIKLKDSIVATMMKPCSELQRQEFSNYLSQYASRRNLRLDIFPPSMLQWLNLT